MTQDSFLFAYAVVEKNGILSQNSPDQFTLHSFSKFVRQN